MIYLCAPTRSRPALVKRLIASIDETCEDARGVTLLLGYDFDDESIKEPFRPARRGRCAVLPLSAGNPDAGIGDLVQRLSAACAEDPAAELIGVCTDDNLFETRGWDAHLRQVVKQEREPTLYYMEDGIREAGDLATAPFFSRATTEALGGIVPGPWSVYNDTWATLLFRLFDPPATRFFPRIVMRHVWQGTAESLRDRTRADFATINRIGSEVATKQFRALRRLMPEGRGLRSGPVEIGGLTMQLREAGTAVEVSLR